MKKLKPTKNFGWLPQFGFQFEPIVDTHSNQKIEKNNFYFFFRFISKVYPKLQQQQRFFLLGGVGKVYPKLLSKISFSN